MNKFTKIYFDPYLFFSILVLSTFGLFFLYSASNGEISIVFKQSIYLGLGFIIMLLTSQADPDLFRRTSLLYIILSVLLLGVTFLFGPEINGAQRWVRIGPFSTNSQTCLQILNIEGVAVVSLFIVLKFYHFTVMQTFHSLFISSINHLFAKCTEKHNLNRPQL